MKTFNRRGDKGETSLLLGPRVRKDDPHCEAYGTIDEAVAALGLARALSKRKRVKHILLGVQKDLFILAGELATPPEAYDRLIKKYPIISESDVQRLEDFIGEIERDIKMPERFVIPGDSPASATVHLARAIIRRAERRVVSLDHDGQVPNSEVLRYLNRLADLLFTLGWYEGIGSAK